MTITLLDGGMGQELRRRSKVPPDDALWSARQMLEEPDLVRQVHEDFLRAGAGVITTNTYATTRWRLNRHGAWDRFGEANRAACEVAKAARDAVNPAALIAGSLPPLRGSYQPDAVPPVDVLEPEYAEQALLLAPHVDLFVAETLSMSVEAVAAARAVATTGKPLWIAYTLNETGPPRLRGDEPIPVAVRALGDLPVAALLINCTSPEAVTEGLPELRAAAGARPVGGFANGFITIPSGFGLDKGVSDLEQREDLDPDAYAAFVARWLDEGATIVGGCCEVGPAHIARLAELIRERG
jgi:S-methylmethionine-dependent homocysteine/selenocysteine methylase